jgi:hypothetical protein
MEHHRPSERARNDQLAQRPGQDGTVTGRGDERARISMVADGMAYTLGVLVMATLWSLAAMCSVKGVGQHYDAERKLGSSFDAVE